ncbi:acetolactate synthase I/III small subunit [Desulfosarcina sp. BuS5]|uniref:acetolactate synthase small subunit n=1 Tax=Desulfosarcina sp. BuS5 TaxID=933262 RepID=UPI00047FA9AF|nr:acetolactate synthase small subunit [Desulfosarcina sp. BuS5]WDN90274.1 acetolactate synthase I/III small subunit [Desulfosarcina sp. BuS5]
MTAEKHVLSILVDNKPGVLSRIAGLFSGRGYNIESLSVAETMDPLVSRVTLVTKADAPVIEQIEKQLNKLINVIKVHDFTGAEYVQREMVLIKVTAKPEHRAEILRMVDIFRCKVVDVGMEHYTIETTGDQGKINAILNLLKPIGIKEIVKTGIIALLRDQYTKK